MRILYSFLITLFIPVLLVRTWLKIRRSLKFLRHSQQGRLKERLAIYSSPYSSTYSDNKTDNRPIWFHTVSVGEFLAIKPLIEDILIKNPNQTLLLTCTTLTGSEQILNNYSDNNQVTHVYLPWDLKFLMNRFYKHFNPVLGLIMETEIWPNLLFSAQKNNCPVWLINARLSEKSAKGYLKFASFSRQIINSFEKICVQNPIDGDRFLQLGLRTDKLLVTGSIKFDIDTSQFKLHPQLQKTKLGWEPQTVICASSTHEGEDEIILECFKSLKEKFSAITLLLIPRHPERFESVYQLAKSTNSELSILKRSQIDNKKTNNIDILIGDSMGEMMAYYQLSDIVIMGGSFINRGGHNLLEPAALGKAIILGPHMFNFQQITNLFISEQACIQTSDSSSSQLIKKIDDLLSEIEKIKTLGKQAKQLMTKHQGAKSRLYKLLKPSLSRSQ